MLYITRHGRTDWNKVRKYQGATDIPLNEEGIEQANELASKCKNMHFDVCYCSPLVRARKTAEIILDGRDVRIIADDRLREMSFGEYEGTCFSEDRSLPMPILFDHPEKYVPGAGGESFKEVLDRTRSFLEECIYPVKEKDILIVGHGALNSAIVCNIENLPIEQFWQSFKNCEIREIEL